MSQRTTPETDTRKAFNLVTEDAKRRGLGIGHGGSGEVDCPISGGKLRYYVAGSNGRNWASCAGKGCVRWLQ